MKKFDLMIEALRLRTRGDSLSNISVRLGVSKSTLQGWFNRLDQAGLNYEKAKSMTPSQLEDALALIRRPTSKDFPPDWHRFIDLVARKARTVQECYDFYCSEACKHGVSAMGRSSFTSNSIEPRKSCAVKSAACTCTTTSCPPASP